MKSIDVRKQRFLDFYDWSKPVTHLFKIDIPMPDGLRMPQPIPANADARIDFAVRKYELLCERAEWLDDDTLPFLDLTTGTEIFAEAFGCKVHIPKVSNPFALPMLKTAEEAARIKTPKLSESPLMRLFELARKARARVGEKALIRMPGILSPMDIAAQIWDKSEFFAALIEEPEAVLELADKTKALLTEFLDLWFAEFGEEYMAHYPDYYMKGGMTLSEDEVGIINAEMFERFSLPVISELSDRYGGIGVHCCADAKHQWDNFKKIHGLKLLNINQPEAVTMEAYEFFSGHTCQMHNHSRLNGEPWTWPDQLGKYCRFIIQTRAKDREEAIRLAEKLREVCG